MDALGSGCMPCPCAANDWQAPHWPTIISRVAVCSHAGLTWTEATTSFSNQIEVYGISFNEADSRKIYFVGSQST